VLRPVFVLRSVGRQGVNRDGQARTPVFHAAFVFIYRSEDSLPGCRGRHASSVFSIHRLEACVPRQAGRLSSFRRPYSFTDTELAEDGIEDLFDIDCSDYFTECM
jgi:hypothetical protein